MIPTRYFKELTELALGTGSNGTVCTGWRLWTTVLTP
jgi:hypothetical protein